MAHMLFMGCINACHCFRLLLFFFNRSINETDFLLIMCQSMFIMGAVRIYMKLILMVRITASRILPHLNKGVNF
jgi:hypothetical protein